MTIAAAVRWPAKYTPGETDNYVTNEIIVKGLTAADLWPYLADTRHWESYYNNASKIALDSAEGTRLSGGVKFHFTTFIYLVKAEVIEYVEPKAGVAGRISWSGLSEGDEKSQRDGRHAWIIEDLPGNRVRILTQESQIGQPAREMHVAKPNPMLNAHQDWIEGLVRIARENKTL